MYGEYEKTYVVTLTWKDVIKSESRLSIYHSGDRFDYQPRTQQLLVLATEVLARMYFTFFLDTYCGHGWSPGGISIY